MAVTGISAAVDQRQTHGHASSSDDPQTSSSVAPTNYFIDGIGCSAVASRPSVAVLTIALLTTSAGCIDSEWEPCPSIQHVNLVLFLGGTTDTLERAEIDAFDRYGMMMSCEAPGGWHDFTVTGASTATVELSAAVYDHLRLFTNSSIVRLSGTFPLHDNGTLRVDLTGDTVNVTLNREPVHIERSEVLRDLDALEPFGERFYPTPGQRFDRTWHIPVNTSWNQGIFVDIKSPDAGAVLSTSHVQIFAPDNSSREPNLTRDPNTFQATHGPLEVGTWRVRVVVDSTRADAGIHGEIMCTY